MADPARLRDSTEILLPADAVDGLEDDLERRFTLTIREEECRVRIIGSPVEIKDASDFLARNGISVA
ncbi:VNG_1110C family protein [Halosimplex sp. J119]